MLKSAQMAYALGRELPERLVRDLEDVSEKGCAIVLTTLDELGYPHTSLLTSAELVLEKAEAYLILQSGSRTEGNLLAREKCSLVLIDAGSVHYIKMRACSVAPVEDCRVFRLVINQVMEDVPANHESGASVVSGIRFDMDREAWDTKVAFRALVIRELKNLNLI